MCQHINGFQNKHQNYDSCRINLPLIFYFRYDGRSEAIWHINEPSTKLLLTEQIKIGKPDTLSLGTEIKIKLTREKQGALIITISFPTKSHTHVPVARLGEVLVNHATTYSRLNSSNTARISYSSGGSSNWVAHCTQNHIQVVDWTSPAAITSE